MEILHQLAELFLAAVPTVILVFLFYLFLRASFFKPLERVLAERAARTEGARREAQAAQLAAQEKFGVYHQALQRARAEIYSEQEAARRAALDERARLIRDSRHRANEEIRAAKDRIAKELASARAELERESPALAGEIARAILGQGRAGAPEASEAR